MIGFGFWSGNFFRILTKFLLISVIIKNSIKNNFNKESYFQQLKEIIKHIFSKKSLQIRLTTFIWVLLCSWYWIGDPIKSSNLAISVLIGSMIIQGFYEWIYDKNL